MSANEEATTAVRDLMARLRYKPGASFVVVPDGSNSLYDPAVCIDMGFDVPDSVDGKPSRAGAGLFVPEAIAHDSDAVLALIRERLITFETHEVDEFLTFDGRRVKNPHAVPSPEPSGDTK